MKVIGLTGGVGSGKTTVANVLREQFGAYLIITDDIARNLMEPGQISYTLTVEHFGNGILDQNGNIDRGLLASIVFADEEKLAILNSFSHPYVEQEVARQIQSVKEENIASMIVVETALLIQVGYHEFCDEVWCVCVDEQVREFRLQENRGYSVEKTREIRNKQMSDEVYRQYATHIIWNLGDKNNLVEQISQLV